MRSRGYRNTRSVMAPHTEHWNLGRNVSFSASMTPDVRMRSSASQLRSRRTSDRQLLTLGARMQRALWRAHANVSILGAITQKFPHAAHAVLALSFGIYKFITDNLSAILWPSSTWAHSCNFECIACGALVRTPMSTDEPTHKSIYA